MKITLAVLFGGRSVEHEISIISALQAVASLDRNKYDVIPVYISKDNAFYVGESVGDIEAYRNLDALIKKSTQVLFSKEGDTVQLVKTSAGLFAKKVVTHIDVAFPIVHGTNVEDGTLQGYLKMLNIPFVGCDVLASAVGMDKYMMKTVLKDNDIPVLDCRCFSTADYNDPDSIVTRVEAAFPYPLIVKPVNSGSSIGISKAKDKESLLEALDLAFEFANRILVEPAVQNMREINCAVVGDINEAFASECEEPINADEILSYKDKYLGNAPKTGGSKGMASTQRIIPAEIPAEMKQKIQQMAVDAFQCLCCNGVARLDFLIDKTTDTIWVNEINTIPGSLSFYLWEAGGMAYSELLERMINLALKRHREEQNINSSFETNVLAGVKLGGTKGSKLKV